MKPTSLSTEMTIRLQGITAQQLAALTEATKTTTTDIQGAGDTVTEPGNKIPFVKIEKAEMKGEDSYTVIIRVHTKLTGWIYPPLSGKDRRWANVEPSWRCLGSIFSAVGILPEEEKIEDLPNPDPARI